MGCLGGSRIKAGRPRSSSIRIPNGTIRGSWPSVSSSEPQKYLPHSDVQVSQPLSPRQSVYPVVSIPSRQPRLVWSLSQPNPSRGMYATLPASCLTSDSSGVSFCLSYPHGRAIRLKVSTITGPMAPPQPSRALRSRIPSPPGNELVLRPMVSAQGS